MFCHCLLLTATFHNINTKYVTAFCKPVALSDIIIVSLAYIKSNSPLKVSI